MAKKKSSSKKKKSSKRKKSKKKAVERDGIIWDTPLEKCLEIFKSRSKRSRSLDLKYIAHIPRHSSTWARNPSRYDLPGVDAGKTKRSSKKKSSKKSSSKKKKKSTSKKKSSSKSSTKKEKKSTTTKKSTSKKEKKEEKPKEKITINILPSNKEPKYFVKIWIEGRTYHIRDVLKELGFKWEGNFWTKYIDPFKHDIKKEIKKIKDKLSKYAEVRVYSTYFIGRSFDEGIKRIIEYCREWKKDYSNRKGIFMKVLKKYGCSNTIKEIEKGTLEVSHIPVKTKVGNDVVVVPKHIKIMGRIENFNGVYSELKKLNYKYRGMFRWFEVRPSKVVRK